MITVGSVTREEAGRRFYFLQENIRGRRKAIHELTHEAPDFVFWIYPDGRLFDAKDAHLRNYPKGIRGQGSAGSQLDRNNQKIFSRRYLHWLAAAERALVSDASQSIIPPA